jgi:replication-associated recombination protein RarA
MNKFDAVQAAAKARSTNTLNTDSLARQIVTASDGDARMAYDFLDTLNAHVTRLLQEEKQ